MKRFNFAGFLGLLAVMIGLLAAAYIAGVASASTGAEKPRGLSMLMQGLFSQNVPDSNLVEAALARIKDQYFMEITPEEEKQLRYSAVQGMLEHLRAEPYKDDFSNFYDPELYKELTAQTEGHYAGIGVLMGQADQYPYPRVEQVFEGSPAESAGLEKDDIIVTVDGTSCHEMILPQVATKIKGDPGTKVKLEVIRPSSGELLNKEITRQDVNYKSVQDVKLLDGKVGYIKVTTFAEQTPDDFRAAMEELSKQGMKSLIIDLRDNGGGLLEAAQGVADCFIDDGMIVEVAVRSPSEQGQTEKLFADPNSKKYKLPVIVMVNSGSASSSEVLTSALRDYGVARVFGDRSFGKGVVQAVTPMQTDSEGQPISALAVTIGKYYTKSHTEIHGKGIEPDLWYTFQNELKDDAQLQKYNQQLDDLQEQMNKIRADASKYLEKQDISLAHASALASKLGRGEVVANVPELKVEDTTASPFELLAGRAERESEIANQNAGTALDDVKDKENAGHKQDSGASGGASSPSAPKSGGSGGK